MGHPGQAGLERARPVDRAAGPRLDGIMCRRGHVGAAADRLAPALEERARTVKRIHDRRVPVSRPAHETAEDAS